MFEYIDKLRRSPEPVRRRFVVAFSASVFALILAGWTTSLVFRIKSGTFAPEGGASSSLAATGIVESWKEFMASVGDAIDATSEAFEAGSQEAAESATTTAGEGGEDATIPGESDIIEPN